jgi:hypothetical protein
MSDILLTPMSGDLGRATNAAPRHFTGSFTAEEMSFCYVVVQIESVSAGIGALSPATISWETSFNDGDTWSEIVGTVKDDITAAGQFFARFTSDVTIVGPICRVTITPPAGESLVVESVVKSRVTDLVVFRAPAGGGGGGGVVPGDAVNITGAAQYASGANKTTLGVTAHMVGFDGATQKEVALTSTGAMKTEEVANNVIDSVRIDYALTPVTTLAWTTVFAATAGIIEWFDIFDSSGETLELASGAPGAEVRIGYVLPGGCRIVDVVPAGTRISLRAASNDTGGGEFTCNAFG